MFNFAGEKFHSKEERTNVELECLLALERIDEVVEKLTKLLHEKPDQWSFIRTYIDCQIQRYLRMRDERASKEESGEPKEGGEEKHGESGSSQLTSGGEANGDDRTAVSGGGRVECVERTAGGNPSATQQDQQESECAEARYICHLSLPSPVPYLSYLPLSSIFPSPPLPPSTFLSHFTPPFPPIPILPSFF